jgi:RNA polymerase sigma-70 factor (ECF subfamily)
MADARNRAERFRHVYEAHHHRILGYALRRVERPEDAADVVAETFLVAWRRLDDIPEGREALLWLYGTARRVLANLHRTERRRSRLVERLRREIASLPAVVSPAATEEVRAVLRALDQLREEDREILRLAAWEDLSHQEIAQVLRCSANAAKIRLHRARRRLAAQLSVVEARSKPVEGTGHARIEPGTTGAATEARP